MAASLDEANERYSDANEDVLRYAPAMQKIARAYVRDDATAEDVVQEAWLGVLRGLATFEGRSSARILLAPPHTGAGCPSTV